MALWSSKITSMFVNCCLCFTLGIRLTQFIENQKLIIKPIISMSLWFNLGGTERTQNEDTLILQCCGVSMHGRPIIMIQHPYIFRCDKFKFLPQHVSLPCGRGLEGSLQGIIVTKAVRFHAAFRSPLLIEKWGIVAGWFSYYALKNTMGITT